MTQRPVSEKILRNTGFNIAGQVFAFLVGMALVPFVITKLGQGKYGIWVVVFAFIEYLTLFDFGFGVAAVKYSAEYFTARDYQKIGQIVSLSVLFYSLFLPVVMVPIFLRDSIICFMHIPPADCNEASFVLVGALLLFAGTSIFGVFRNILIGLQRIDITTLFRVGYTLLNAVATVWVLQKGFGLRGLVVAAAVCQAAQICAQAFLVFRMVPHIAGGLARIDLGMFSTFFRYGIKLQVSGLAGLFNFSYDKLLIGRFLHMEMVTLYEIGAKITMFIRTIPLLLLPPLLPAASELNYLNDRERLKDLYLRGSKYITLITAPLALFLWESAPLVLRAWMGDGDYRWSVVAVRILSIGYFFNVLTGIATNVARGMGVPQYEMRACSLIAAANFILSTVLTIKIGFVGALIGTSVSMTVGNIYYLYIFSRYMKESLAYFCGRVVVGPLLAAVAGAIVIHGVQYLLFHLLHLSEERMLCAAIVVIEAVMFGVVYSSIILATKYLDPIDRAVFQKFIPALRGKQ